MNFGEKLFKLRKEKGLSQETLAEMVGTTRQAVSKWENGQGFPETEKLLQLSNIFDVSVDFLLKEESTAASAGERGFYVSREMAAGYLASEKRLARCLAFTFLFWALAGVPYALFPTQTAWRFFGMAACFAAGLIFLVLGIFTEQDAYKVLKTEPLLFDREYSKELSAEYAARKKKYVLVAVPCTILFVAGLVTVMLTVRGPLVWSEYHALVFLGLAVGLAGFVYTGTMMDAYELLVKNEEHIASFSFKLRRKFREWIDRL